jgi:hypothetical protein
LSMRRYHRSGLHRRLVSCAGSCYRVVDGDGDGYPDDCLGAPVGDWLAGRWRGRWYAVDTCSRHAADTAEACA